jgi:flagellar hook assembly protein FlgD
MLSFGLPRDGDVELSIVDIAGRDVRLVHRGALAAGQHHMTWDGHGTSGQIASPGVYFAVLRYEGRNLTKRIIHLP